MMVSRTLVVVVVAAVGLLTGVRPALPWDDPCRISPAGSELTEEGGEISVPAQCQEGEVWWNYPRGTLQVNFQQAGRQFTVCLSPALGPLLSSISQLLDSGRQQTVTSPPEGETVCLPEAGSQVTVLLEQPPFLTYMTLYNFTLHFQP